MRPTRNWAVSRRTSCRAGRPGRAIPRSWLGRTAIEKSSCVALFVYCMLGDFAAATDGPEIPLCTGLRIVTAISQSDGDYESIKTLASIFRIRWDTAN